jgi:hypothetical protein
MNTTNTHIHGRGPAVFLACLIGVMGLWLSACETGAITSPGDVVFPATNVSFGRQVRPLLELGCTDSGCHNAIDRAGTVSFASYIDLFATPGLVHPGDSTGSILWQVVSERLPHAPANIARLVTPAQAHGIAVWINEGASNN